MARILIADDDPDILKIGEAVLVSAGHIVFTAADAIRAMEMLNGTLDFDMLLSDVNMPHYSGYELVGTLRKSGRFNNLAIAMLTGLRDRKDVEKAVQAGADDYIVKPLDPLILIQKVNALFEKRPPQKHPEIHLRGSELSAASLVKRLTVESVSELGVQVTADFELKAGMVLDISSEFFKTLEVVPPPMRVLRVEMDIDPKTGTFYRAQLIYLGATESMLQKIRKWLYNHGSSARSA